MFLDSGFTPLSSVSFSSYPLSDAGANPAWGGKNSRHWDGGIVLWSSRNVGLQLKHRGIDAALSSGWMSADKRVKASAFQPWELLKGFIMAALLVSRIFGKDGLGKRIPDTAGVLFFSWSLCYRRFVFAMTKPPWPPSVVDNREGLL